MLVPRFDSCNKWKGFHNVKYLQIHVHDHFQMDNL
jgi:hypothetical protein